MNVIEYASKCGDHADARLSLDDTALLLQALSYKTSLTGKLQEYL
jgi:hypothetical protein